MVKRRARVKVCNRKGLFRISFVYLSLPSRHLLHSFVSVINKLVSEQTFISTNWYQSELISERILFQQIGIRADWYQREFYFNKLVSERIAIFNKLESERILFQQIGIRADGEHDGTNAATTIDEDELQELKHSNESSSRFSRRMGGGRRRFRRTKGYHGLYGGAKQGAKRITIIG